MSVEPKSAPWPHAPVHLLSGTGTFIVTAGTYKKRHIFLDGPLLRMLQKALLTLAADYQWKLDAWAMFPNHYHFVGHSPSNGAASLKDFLSELHSRTAIAANKFDQTPGREVWHNFWETRLTYEKSYFARLKYVHQNAVKHGLTHDARQYPYCSAAWFEQRSTPAMLKTINSFKIDRVKVVDEF